MEWIIAVLLVYTLVREYMHWKTTQVLLNKLMSRNYYDFKVSEAQTPEVFRPGPVMVPVEEEMGLDSLKGVGIY